jgi:hypothetical protein
VSEELRGGEQMTSGDVLFQKPPSVSIASNVTELLLLSDVRMRRVSSVSR